MSPLHHNDLENFASRALKAQAAVDEVISKHNSPAASPTAGASPSPGTGAGELTHTPPRSPLTKGEEASLELEAISGSNDQNWLRRIVADLDKSLGERRAAERRLRLLRRKQGDNTHKPPTRKSQQKMVDTWNRAHKQLGTKVRVVKDDGSIVDTIATSKAYVIEGHTAVIFLQGFSGCYSLARCTAI